MYCDWKLNCSIVPRNGKSYLLIKNAHHQYEVSDFSMKSKLKDFDPYLNDVIDRMVNSNWRLIGALIEPSLRKYMEEIFISIFSPIFEKIAIQDIIKE